MMMLNGKPAYIRSTDNFKKGIEAMHDAYTKGLIDPELYTLDPTQAQAKLMADTETVGVQLVGQLMQLLGKMLKIMLHFLH